MKDALKLNQQITWCWAVGRSMVVELKTTKPKWKNTSFLGFGLRNEREEEKKKKEERVKGVRKKEEGERVKY